MNVYQFPSVGGRCCMFVALLMLKVVPEQGHLLRRD